LPDTTAKTPSVATPPTTLPRTSGAGSATKAPARHRGRSLHLAGRILLWCSPLLLVAVTPGVNRLRRARRRRTATTPSARVLLAWDEAREHLARLGAPDRRASTPYEYAAGAARQAALPSDAAAALTSLADRVVEASYTPAGATPQAAEAAWANEEVIAATATAARPWWKRTLAAADPRGLRGAGGSLRSGRLPRAPRAARATRSGGSGPGRASRRVRSSR
jgi:hypothetical protein